MTNYGTADVRVEADTQNFHRDLQRELRRGQPVEVAARPDAQGFATQLRRDLRNVVAEIRLKADSRRLVREIERELARIRPPQIQIDVTADTSRAESALRALRAPDVQIDVTAATSQAQSEIASLGSSAPTVQVPVQVNAPNVGAAGAQAGAGFLAGISGALAGAGPWGVVAAAATAGALLVGKAFVTGVETYISGQQILGTFQAQLGATRDQAETYGRAAGRLYAKGVTETAEEGATAVQEAIRAGLQLDPGDLNLEGLSTQLADLANLMEEDLGQTARAVGQMIKTGLVSNAQQGFDLLTKGVQQGSNAAGDLLDTFSEYSTQFRQLGLSGQEAMGLIRQGLQGGARDADVVADTLKEFSIEAAQGAERTNGAFESLGLNAEKLSSAFAKGGPSARQALDQVFDGLRDIEDPLERNQVAVELFGTKAEDLAGALQKMDLSSAAKEMEGFEGSTQRAGDALRDNLGATVSRVGREFKLALGGLFSGDFSGFSSLADSLGDLAGVLNGAFNKAVSEILPKIPGLMLRLGEAIGSSIGTWGPLILKGLAVIATLPGILLGLLGVALAGVLKSIWTTYALPALQEGWSVVSTFFTETIPQFFSTIGATIGEALGAAWDAAWAFVTGQMPGYIQGVLDFFIGLPGLIFEALGSLAGILVAALYAAFTYLWTQVPIWLTNTVNFFTELPGRIVAALASLGSMIGSAFSSAVAFVTSTLPAKIDSILTFFRQLPGKAFTALSALGSRIGSAFTSALASARTKVSSGLESIMGFFRRLPSQITSALSSIGEGIWSGLKTALNAGIRLVNRAVDGFNKFSPIDVPRIPELADGGVVRQRTLAYVGEAGPEAVIPLMRPRRAAQIAEQSGLIDLLQKQGLVVRTGSTDRSQTHHWTINTHATDARSLSQSMYTRMTLATGV